MREREQQIVLALRAPADKSLFEFGRLCGMCQEHQAIHSILEHCLDESDPTGRHEES